MRVGYIFELLLAAKKKTGYACNIIDVSHNRPTCPPRTVNGMRCLVDDADTVRVDTWIADMEQAALKDGLTQDEIDNIKQEALW